jgi:SNF2 family DNA or RNA helicase
MLYSAAHNALIYETDAPLKLLHLCAGAVRLGEDKVAVPATLPNMQALARNDFLVPGPMDKDGYDWPIRAPWHPLPHQKVTANFLALNKRGFCLNDMGTMKTLSSLWAADYLMEMERRAGRTMRALIVAPLSILRAVWGDALFANFMSRRKFIVLQGSAEKRRKLLAQEADFYIINFDGLCCGVSSDSRHPVTGFAADLAAREDIRLVMVDEARVYHATGTRRHHAARKLIRDREYLWLMTGTPTPNGPLDAYGQAKLINDAYGESFQSYRNRVMMPAGPFKWVPRFGAAAAARKLLTPAVRYAIEDCVELPPCTVQRRDAEMSADQTKAYKELKAEAVLMIRDGRSIQAVHQAALRMKLIQVACGCVYDNEHETHEIDAAPRMRVLHEAIEESGGHFIVFSPLTNVLNMLHRELSKTYSCEVINGAVSTDERTRHFRAFQDGTGPRGLIADPATMAHGVTLTKAAVTIWYAPTDKTELYIQGNKRMDRPGQTQSTRIIQIASTPVEREIYDRLENNQSMQGVILKLAEDRT